MSERIPHLPPHLEGQSSWLDKATSARILGHPLVWTGVTALFILAGYLWLQYSARPLSDQIALEHDASELIGGGRKAGNWNPEAYKPTETQEIMTITHQADGLRAEKYREAVGLENTVQPLLRQARANMDQENYTGANNDNAWQNYQQILDRDPENKLAQSGQAQIKGLLQSNAEFAAQQQQYEQAEQWLAQLDRIAPGAPFQNTLRERMAEQISQQVALSEARQRDAENTRLLNEALQDAEAAMQLSPPQFRVAYDLYLRALELDSDNIRARQGLEKIRQARHDTAVAAIENGAFDKARAEIDRLEQTNADPDSVARLRSALQKAESAKTESAMPGPIPPESAKPNIEPAPTSTPEPNPESAPEGAPKAVFEPGARAGIGPDVPASAPNRPQEQKVETVAIQVNKKAATSPVAVSGSVEAGQTDKQARAQQLIEGIEAYYAGDYGTAFARLHPLAEANSPRAQFRIGVMYYQGRTVVKNTDLARQWIARALPAVLRASQKGYAWAQSDLGTAYELGIGVQKDLTRAAGLYQMAAKQGYAGAQTNLGVLYGSGEGVKYDRKVAIYWLKKAALQGDKIAQDNLKILNAR